MCKALTIVVALALTALAPSIVTRRHQSPAS